MCRLLRTHLGDTEFPAHLHAKELTINVDMLDVYSGAALKVLSSESYISCTFPMVRSIIFMFSDSSKSEEPTCIATISPDTESIISAFVQRIKQIAPMTKKINIRQLPYSRNGPQFPAQQFSSIVAQLSQHVIDIEYELYHRPATIDQQLNGLRNLAYCSFESTEGGEQIMQLARRNASTLQFLKIDIYAIIGIASLIQNDNDGYMQYPYLHTFKISGKPGSDVPRQLVFPSAVPFPNLRQLDIGYLTPFGDDAVFRSNAATLESLILMPNPGTLRILRKGKVFTPVSHPKLQYANLGVNLDSEPNLFGTDVEYLRFVLSIGANAPVRTITDSLTGPDFQPAIPVFGEYTCIQVLKLESLRLNLWDVIALVKALPLLLDLHTSYYVLAPRPDGVAEHELPAYVIANYAPTGKRFRCCHFSIDPTGDVNNSVRCVLLLALVCPNFDYAAVTRTDRDLFMAYMKAMIAIDEFRPYESRLQRLLFGGPENRILSVDTLLEAKEAGFGSWGW
ncbi:hypothetical protein GGI17_005443 [Coemansia sp. S146]|nr:hypothetical protein GGI17_005443 [Coemansia sp. S146]